MPTATEDKQPEKIKRPAYRSYESIIKHLVAQAHKRVKDSREIPRPRPTEAELTPAIKKTIADLKASRIATKRLEKALEAHGLEVASYGENRVEFTYTERTKREQAPDRQFEARKRKVEQLKVQAILDTIDMTPRQAKAYFLKLENTLAAV